MPQRYLEHDVVRLWKDLSAGRGLSNLTAMLYRGDPVDVVDEAGGATKIRLSDGKEGWVRARVKTSEVAPLAFAFIDVGQGDACLITAPNGARVLVDGGENQMAARYLASRFWHETIAGGDVRFDAIVVTHGDADHFDGLSTLVLDAAQETRDRKRIRVVADRVFHNGLVKRSKTSGDSSPLGPVTTADARDLLKLVDDPRSVTNPNRGFRRWQDALNELAARGPVAIAALDASKQPFDFLGEVRAEVLGPRTVLTPDGAPALPLRTGDASGSRTINGHSVVLRFVYGRVAVLLTADMNAESEDELVTLRGHALRSEILKVPHHGSDDVSKAFVQAVNPLISIISAGDEDELRDHLHPRANLVGLLGRSTRGADPVVFVTNLAAFDKFIGRAYKAKEVSAGCWAPDAEAPIFYARERIAYGIVHVRTDGEKLLVIRRGARADRYEAYAYAVGYDGYAEALEVDVV